LKQVGKTSN